MSSFEKNAKAILAKLGIKASDVELETFSADDTLKTVVNGIVENNKGDIEIEAKKVAFTAAYTKATKQLAVALGLDFTKYEKLDKRQFETALEDVAEKHKEATAEKPTTTTSDKEAAALQTIRKQYDELNDTYKAAILENKGFKSQIDDFPNLLKAGETTVRAGYEKSAHIKGAFAQLRKDGLNPMLSDAMLIAAVNEVSDLVSIETNEGFAFQVTDKLGKPIKKSASEAYSSLADFMKDKVVKDEWLIKTNSSTTGGVQQSNPTHTTTHSTVTGPRLLPPM